MNCSRSAKRLAGTASAALIFFACNSIPPQPAEAEDAPAHAAHQNVATDRLEAYAKQEGISTEQVFYMAAKELEASSLERNIDQSGTHYIYSFTNGSTLSFPSAAEFENRMSAGFENGQIWLELTPFEQKLAATGGIGGIEAAVCTAGPAACVVGGIIAGGLAFYVSERGVCPNDQRMTLYFTRSGSFSWARCGSK